MIQFPTEGGLTIGLRSAQECFLGSFGVFFLSLPGFQTAGLQSTPVTEADIPRLFGSQRIHSIQVQTGILFALAAGEELL